MEGDTTNFYIYRRLAPFSIKISLLSRGVAMGDELEYTDDVTLHEPSEIGVILPKVFNLSAIPNEFGYFLRWRIRA